MGTLAAITNHDMDINLIKIDNRQKLGEYFFDLGYSFIKEKEFGKAYEFFIKSLDCITCDCFINGQLKKTIDLLELIFIDLENNVVSPKEYYFAKAFLFSYSENKKLLYLATDSIERYLNLENDEYGLYVRAKISGNLNEEKSAILYINNALKLNKNPRLKYRLGRYKEDVLKNYGLVNLLESFIENPSSGCCAKEIKKAFLKYDLKFEILPNYTENILLLDFISNKPYMLFGVKYEKFYLEQIKNSKNIIIVREFIENVAYNLFLINENQKRDAELENDRLRELSIENDDWTDDSTSVYDNEYYNDSLDMDQQSPEFWDSI